MLSAPIFSASRFILISSAADADTATNDPAMMSSRRDVGPSRRCDAAASICRAAEWAGFASMLMKRSDTRRLYCAEDDAATPPSFTRATALMRGAAATPTIPLGDGDADVGRTPMRQHARPTRPRMMIFKLYRHFPITLRRFFGRGRRHGGRLCRCIFSRVLRYVRREVAIDHYSASGHVAAAPAMSRR